MAERSQFWNTGTTGDGTTTITEAQTTEWFQDIITPFASAGPHTSEGVLLGCLGELAVSGASSPVAVAAGAAAVEGFYYKNTASVNVAIPTPSSATRIDRIVLRSSHSTTRTVRITRIAGTEGAGVPAMTQVAGTTWDIPIANVTITTGGIITISDQRVFAYFGTKVKTSMLDDASVTSAKLRNSAAVSVIGRSVNSSGVPADIAAASDGLVLNRTAGVVGFGQVANAGILNDAVDDTKVGNRVPQFIRRQGGSATDWKVQGTTTQTPTMVREQAGVTRVALSSASHFSVVVTFPIAFSQAPLVLASLIFTSASLFSLGTWVVVNVSTTTVGTCIIEVVAGAVLTANIDIAWWAIGAE